MTGPWKWIKEPFGNAGERYVALQAGDDRDILDVNVNTNFGTWIEVWDDDVAAMIAAAPETAVERDRLRETNAELMRDIETLFELHEAVCFRAEIDPQGARAVLQRAIARACEGQDA